MALGGVYDGLMLVGGLLLIASAAVWVRYQGDLGRLYTRLLAWVDRPAATRSKLLPAAEHDRPGRQSSLPAVLLGGVVLGTAGLRLWPLLGSPAPFSMTHYRFLEMAKHLQANQLFPGGLVEARGLHGLSVALHALSAVDLSLVLRMLGVLASVALVVGIYLTTRGYTGDTVAALGAAGLFGFGLPVLPLALENQVEPTTALVATVYALPAWYFLTRYQESGARTHLGVGAVSLLVVILTDGAVAALVVTLVGGLGLLRSAWAQTRPHARRALIQAAVCAGGGALLGGLALAKQLFGPTDPYAVPRLSVETGAVSFHAPELSLPLYGALVAGTTGALLLAAFTDPRASLRRMSLGLAVACPVLFMTWAVPDVRMGLFDAQAAITLLSAFLPVALGGLLAWGLAGARSLFRSVAWRPALRPLHYGAVPGALLVALFASPAPLLPSMGPAVEPPGYVRAIHAIQQTVSPYEWTAVSHYGTAVHAMNEGRFLEYDYFLRHYRPETYDHASLEAIPTRHLFLFVPTAAAIQSIRDELRVSEDEVPRSMQRWCARHRLDTGSFSLFYSDKHLAVYQLSRAPRDTRQMETLLSRSFR